MTTDRPLQLGMIGLGRMGANLGRRLMRDGHDLRRLRRERRRRDGARGERRHPVRRPSTSSWPPLRPPRAAWVMVPAAHRRRAPSTTLAARMDAGRHRHRRRQHLLPRRHPTRRGAHAEGHPLRRRRHQRGRVRPRARLLPDDRRRGRRRSRTSTRSSRPSRPGVGDAERTPGRTGDPTTDEQGYLHCGPTGAGHFVKMVHNGIEYGIMAAYAEGLNILKHADVGHASARDATPRPRRSRDPEYYQYDIDIAGVAEVWRRGSVVGVVAARPRRPPPSSTHPELAEFEGRVRTPARAGGPRSPRSTRACPAGADGRALRPVRARAARRLRQQGAVRDAQAVRRPRREAGEVAAMPEAAPAAASPSTTPSPATRRSPCRAGPRASPSFDEVTA